MYRQMIQPTHFSVYLVVYQIQEVKTMVYEQVPDQTQASVATENIKYNLLYMLYSICRDYTKKSLAIKVYRTN